jgi:hypothetical protein
MLKRLAAWIMQYCVSIALIARRIVSRHSNGNLGA